MGPCCPVLQTYPGPTAAARSGYETAICSVRAAIFRSFCAGTFVFSPDCFHREFERHTEVLNMLGWVVTFLIIALIAGLLGFGGIAGASIEIAKIIFFIALVLFLVSAVVGIARGRRI
jgi:uncharacterized membrane protein YtjA (UPF0391 family)